MRRKQSYIFLALDTKNNAVQGESEEYRENKLKIQYCNDDNTAGLLQCVLQKLFSTCLVLKDENIISLGKTAWVRLSDGKHHNIFEHFL